MQTHSPVVFTLPNELISEIFCHFIPEYPLCPPHMGLSSPTILTHICRRWRQIALGTPELWRAISMLDQGLDEVEEPYPEAVEFWLQHSGCLPLSLHAHVEWYAISGRLSSTLFSIILPYRQRWQYVMLRISPANLLLIEGPMPLLRDCEIFVDHDPDTDGIPSPSEVDELAKDFGTLSVIAEHAPLLETVILESELSHCTTILPWSYLTSLTLYDTTTRHSHPILREAVSLIFCEIHLSGADTQAEIEDIKLEDLETLIIQWSHDWDCEPIPRYLDAFYVLSLRSLKLHGEFLGLQSVEALHAFIGRSECELKKVVVTKGWSEGSRELEKAHATRLSRHSNIRVRILTLRGQNKKILRLGLK